MNSLLDASTNFIELDENILKEINGGLPWKTIAKVALGGLGGGIGYGVSKKIFG